MGLNTRSNVTYLTILNGKVVQSFKEATPLTKSRVNKQGRTVHEIAYDSFDGKLTNISIKESKQFGKSWIFHFEDEGEKFQLQLSYSNSYATALLKMLPNIDLSKPFSISPSVKTEGDKTISSLFVRQNDQPIKHAFTKDAPNGMPDMQKIKVSGMDKWDDTDRLDFLLNMVNTEIMPKLQQAAVETKNTDEKEGTEVAEDIATDIDDLAAAEKSPF